MTRFFFLIALLSVTALNFHCKKSPTEPTGNLSLTVEDVSCTEAWVKITSANFQNTSALSLFVDDKLNQSITLVNGDTLLYVDSLLPNHSYKLKASVTTNNQQLTTNELVATTMDTTSHNFSAGGGWQSFTFGEHSSSTLYDVAIIDENNIWAVGEIYMNDSLGRPDPNAYNAVHWDGNKWELIKIGGSGGWACRTVLAFSKNDIWFEGTIHWDGSKITVHQNGFPLQPNGDGWQINKMWGTSSSDLYAVGNGGNIAHYNGVSWKKIESGTTAIIGDICGIVNNKDEFDKYLTTGEALIKLDSKNNATKIEVEGDMFLSVLWGKSERLIYTAGNGVVLYKNNKWEKVDKPEINKIYGIKGQDYNDVYGISAAYAILHFNGYSWETISSFPNHVFYRLDVKKNTTVAAGWFGDKATITIVSRK